MTLFTVFLISEQVVVVIHASKYVPTLALAVPLGIGLNAAVFSPNPVGACQICSAINTCSPFQVFGSSGCSDSGDGSYCDTTGDFCFDPPPPR